MHDAPYEMVQKTIVRRESSIDTYPHSHLVKAAGTAIPSFTSRLISDNLSAGKGPVHDEEDIKGVAGTLYGGDFQVAPLGFRRSSFTR
jgi:hypothetical protein